jgi:hypothetical protein
MTTKTKGKGTFGEGNSKSVKVPSTSKQVFILPTKPPKEELLSN